jgi:hypothetical protein
LLIGISFGVPTVEKALSEAEEVQDDRAVVSLAVG